MKPLSEEFGDLADELARKHRVPFELVVALLELEGNLPTEGDPISEQAAAKQVGAVLLANPFKGVAIGKR